MEKVEYTIRTNCRLCGSSSLFPFIDLGFTPLADKFLDNPNDVEQFYPLKVKVCQHCKLVQQVCDVNDDILFGDDYAFYTGASPSSVQYFKDYADNIKRRFPEQAKGFVVEVASNDGTLLKNFTDSKTVLGIEPTANTAKVAQDNGIITLVQPFNFETAVYLAHNYGRADIIMANNVFAHVTDPNDFIKGIAQLLKTDGVAIIEFQYFPHLLFNNAFDHIYHEHRSFFSLTPLVAAFEQAGLHIFDCEPADGQGGSLRIFVSRVIPPSNNVKRQLRYETLIKLDQDETYMGFQARVAYMREQLQDLIAKVSMEGKTIAAYGASAKGNTLLNVFGLNKTLLPYILDMTPYKIGKLSPGRHIPVIDDDTYRKPDYYLLLVWNYKKAILERERAYREQGGKFIVPIPNVEII